MGAKRFVTSTPPAKIKGGLDAILSQGIFNTGAKGDRRQNKKRKLGVDTRGGDEKVVNSWSKTPAGCKASTVVKQPTEMEFTARIGKTLVVLGDESTYTSSMLKSKYEEEIKNPQKQMTKHKTNNTRTKGYLDSLNKSSGRRVIANNPANVKSKGWG